MVAPYWNIELSSHLPPNISVFTDNLVFTDPHNDTISYMLNILRIKYTFAAIFLRH